MSLRKESPVLPPASSRTSTTQGLHISPSVFSFLAAVTVVCYWASSHCVYDHLVTPSLPLFTTHSVPLDTCFQPDPLAPKAHRALWESLNAAYGTDSFRTKAVDWLGGAVRIPTEVFDDFGAIGEDTRWDVFFSFYDYLRNTFPRVHATLQLAKVNTHGLLYTWSGSDESLKPLLLAAHQDVVPVEPSTADEWKYPPFSGHFDGKCESIWGRGSADDKNGLIGVLSAVESLIERDFQPTRTIILAFGFDEEASGKMGAGELSKVLEKIYGKNGIAMVVDEGGGFGDQFGTIFALLGTSEKGYLDVSVEVTAPGGHSSIPPEHTTIGILSRLLVELEANPPEARLTREDSLFITLQCYARHAKDLPPDFRKVIKHAASSDKALRALEMKLFKDPTYKNLVGTTQAIDMVQGGVKANALPEKATALVNNRISAISSVGATKNRVTELFQPLAIQFNLTYNPFTDGILRDEGASSGKLTLADAYQSALEPAPITPTDRDAIPYRLISGTIRATYNAHRSLSGADNIFVSPTMPPGNTDTQFYWNLTRHIYRYNHGNMGVHGDPLHGMHTVNEYLEIDAFLEMIQFFTTLILNADEATGM